MTAIHLGYEVGTGQPVEIPLHHLVITGQTQLAGKTTALEALVERSGVRAVAFITKRGEGSFRDARIVPPYFREQADWKYVAAILEASRGEKLKFERAWIIRASKGATSLADVQRNVRRELKTAKGLSGDVYLTLEAYLEDVVPQIESVQWAKRVQLAPGLNAMDLTGISTDMQHLVIRSTIEWVLQHEENTVVVVPEAWKFIPQGRGTPVKLAAEAFIRQAAGLGNYLWLDSQDIAGVEKMILKSVPVWILGVQRESNEVKRTLDQIPAGIAKPKLAEIATLGLGQFYACHGRETTKTYVQPVWLDEGIAREIATGERNVRSIEAPRRAASTHEDTVNEQEARRLRAENERLGKELSETREKLTYAYEQIEAMEKRLDEMVPPKKPSREPTPASISPAGSIDIELIYDEVKRRLSKEAPTLLKVLTVQPELEVTVERKVITAGGATLKGRIGRLIARGWFSQTKKHTETRKELERTGAAVHGGNLSTTLNDLVKEGFLTNEGDGYREVADMKVNIVEA